MPTQPSPTASADGQIRQALSGLLGCQPRPTGDGLSWRPRAGAGVESVLLKPAAAGHLDLEIGLGTIPATSRAPLHELWNLVAGITSRTEQGALPLLSERDSTGAWRLAARISVRDVPLDLPRLQRLRQALDVLVETARAVAALVPPPQRAAPTTVLPDALRQLVRPHQARLEQDSGAGEVAPSIRRTLMAGLSVALVGSRERTALEVDRLARSGLGIAILRDALTLDKLPPLAEALRPSGHFLAAPCALLRGRMGRYEQGDEIDAALNRLAASGTGVLTTGTWEESNRLFGIGQGRDHSPLRPVIEDLPPCEPRDLVRSAVAGQGADPRTCDRLADQVMDVMKAEGCDEASMGALSRLAVELGPADAGLAPGLRDLARDLGRRRATFGTCAEAPPRARPRAVQRQMADALARRALERAIRDCILGQEAAIGELVARVEQETARADDQPLRLLLAGPVGTGKSIAAKAVARALGFAYHYIDAASFDGPHAVNTSLAGSSPGIVNSYNDGALARMARRPSVVEVADLDHAQPHVRTALCEFFLRILGEGTLQTGSGQIVRTVPWLFFVFTSNVAFARGAADAAFGFGAPSRRDVRRRVEMRMGEDLGAAFVSRVGSPVLFARFTRSAAEAIAAREVETRVRRWTGAQRVVQSEAIAGRIVDALPSLETGARGVIDAAGALLAGPLLAWRGQDAAEVVLALEGDRVTIEPRRGEREETDKRAQRCPAPRAGI